MATLAVLILTKNEEQNITDAVTNAKQCADEVIVIDSGSTDATKELAEKAGAKVVYRAWDDDFSAQRNFGLAQTQADWVLYLDADERLNAELVQAVLAVKAAPAQDKQYAFVRKSIAFGQEFNYGVLLPDKVSRMFPRTKVNWVNKVHEHPECSLPLTILPGYVQHYTYTSWEQWEKKFCQYTTIWAESAAKEGRTISLPAIFGHSLAGFFKMFVIRRGFLDGWLGIYMCFNHFFYTMLKYLKLYARQGR